MPLRTVANISLFAPCSLVLAFLLPLCFHSPVILGQSQAQSPTITRPLPPPIPSQHPGFERIIPSGVSFTNHLDFKRSIQNGALLGGSGVAAGDVNGDGLCDLYFCQLEGPNALYLNQGEWNFQEVASSSGVDCPEQDSTGACLVDIDGDYDLDLLVSSLSHSLRLFLNNGQGQFHDATLERGLLLPGKASTSLTLSDIDGDLDLDLYVTHYRPDTIKDQPQTHFEFQMIEGRPVITRVNGESVKDPKWANRFEMSPSGEVIEMGQPDQLFRNNGLGFFEAVSFTDGTFLDHQMRALNSPPLDWGLAARFHDINSDGWPDLYVCNDFSTPDRLWFNDGTGRFIAASPTQIRNFPLFSMGVDFADIDGDLDYDFFVTDMVSPSHERRHVQTVGASPMHFPPESVHYIPQIHRNALYLNRGNHTFANAEYLAKLQATDWSWGPIFLDIDLDGWMDLLIPTGQLHDTQNADLNQRIQQTSQQQGITYDILLPILQSFPPLKTPNHLYRNHGNLHFEEISAEWGFADATISQGMALADLDGDGDLDVITNNLLDPPGFYRNLATAPRVAIQLRAPPPNTHAIGAQLKLLGGPQPQIQQAIAGGRYLSSDQALITFAASTGTQDSSATSTSPTQLTLEIRWPGGKITSHSPILPQHLYQFEAPPKDSTTPPQPTSNDAPSSPTPIPLLSELTDLPSRVHLDKALDDFERQSLLPRELDTAGPGVAWVDLNQDGNDDLVLGSGQGGGLSVLLQSSRGTFEKITHPTPLTRDQSGIVPWCPTPSTLLLLVGSSSYEDALSAPPQGPLLHTYSFPRLNPIPILPQQPGNIGPIALGNLTGDNRLNLFLGERALPGKFPETNPSQIYQFQGNQWAPLHQLPPHRPLNAALITNLDAQGLPELLISEEWGTLRIFRYQPNSNRFEELTQSYGLSSFKGIWQGIATADFNQDGLLDIAATNWGLNTPYQPTPQRPNRLHYGSLLHPDQNDLLEGYFPETGNERPFRTWPTIRQIFPFLTAKIPTSLSYAQSTLNELYGSILPTFNTLEINHLASTLFLNQGDHFIPIPLPLEAQLSPSFGINAGDFNGDGFLDLFLSQNFYPNHPETPRHDAGLGLLLLGEGTGHFTALAPHHSGISILGEQRGSAVADFDQDGRLDLAVAENSGPYHLYQNQTAIPAWRIKLKGLPQNPMAIGTQAYLFHSRTGLRGPTQEIQAGAGYLSHNSTTLLLSSNHPADTLHIRWPNGITTQHPLPGERKPIHMQQPSSN